MLDTTSTNMSLQDLGLNKKLYRSNQSLQEGALSNGLVNPTGEISLEPGTIIQGSLWRNFTQNNEAVPETNSEKLQIGPNAIIQFDRPASSYSQVSGDFSFPTLVLSPSGIVFGDPDQANVYAGGFYPVGNLPYGGIPAFPNQSGFASYGPNGQPVLRIGDINPTPAVTYGFLVQSYPFFKAHPDAGTQAFRQPITLGYGRVGTGGLVNSTSSSPLWTCNYLGTGQYEMVYIGSPLPLLYDYNVQITPEDNFNPVVAQVANRNPSNFIVHTYDILGNPYDSQFSFHVTSNG